LRKPKSRERPIIIKMIGGTYFLWKSAILHPMRHYISGGEGKEEG
jgi:hypothetical protein